MKKFLAMLLAVVMVLGLFAACGKTETPSDNDATPSTSNENPADNAETSADAPASDDPFAEEVTLHWVIPAARDSYQIGRASCRERV